jgi:hypothetical protein
MAACHSETNPKPKQPSKPQIQGYRDIRFGDTFREVLGKTPTGIFEPVSVKDCLENLPLRGCALGGDRDGYREFTVVDGIPYRLSVVFNRHDAATDISLTYKKEGDVSQAECIDIHIRTLNWLLKEYGTFGEDQDNIHFIFQGVVTEGQKKQLNRFASATGFVSGFARTVSATPDWGKPITRWDKSRYVDLFTYYLDLNGGICDLEVGFREPVSIERSPPAAIIPTPAAKVPPRTAAEQPEKDGVGNTVDGSENSFDY